MPDHDHHHHHAHQVDLHQANSRSFTIGIGLNVFFVITEIIAGFLYGSISLLTDAGHNASDVASLLISLFAFRLARRKPTSTFTYGFKKTTVLAALTNAIILLIAIGGLGMESISRLKDPRPVQGGVIAWVAAVGIVINALSAFLFYRNRNKDLNVKSAYLHLLADAVVSVGVVIGGIIISFTNWFWIDPVIGLGIMVVILFSTWSLLRDSFKMMVDAVPSDISVSEIIKVMRRVKNVSDVNHVHIWSLSTTENALTAHVIVNESLSFEEKLRVIETVKHELQHHSIHHSTLELGTEKSTDQCEVQLPARDNKHN
jgi:cobalt-zinc-cadmium efflux system protein